MRDNGSFALFVLGQLVAPADGTVFFQHKTPLVYASTAVIKLAVHE